MKTPVLLICDDPQRFQALRRSALAGRAVHFWLHNGRPAPRWSTGLHGDPTDPATYGAIGDRDVVVMIDLEDQERSRQVARAARTALPEAPVLVVDREHGRRNGSIRGGVTWIDEGELLADAIEHMLQRAAARRRITRLRRALRGSRRCAFLVQNDPDPDAIASALALRATLGFTPESSPIITCGGITRPENRRLIGELKVKVRHVSTRELRRMAPLVLVDVQPPYFGGTLTEVAAVIDHHPPTGEYRTRHRDVRTQYGASATMAAEYLLACDPRKLSQPLATALLYGIITDTKSLSRSASPDDLAMFAHLFLRADHAALRRIQHPSYEPLALRRLGRGLETVRVRDGLAYVHLGMLPRDQEHVVAQFAEFCLGIAGAQIGVVSGVFASRLVLSARAIDPRAALGERLHRAFDSYGSAGGHPVMAKAVIRMRDWRAAHPSATGGRALERTVREELQRALRGRRPRVSSRGASPARR